MGRALDSVNFLGASVAFAAMTPSPGDSNIVRYFPAGFSAHMVSAWMKSDPVTPSNLVVEVRSPNLANNTVGIHLEQENPATTAVLDGHPLLFSNPPQSLVSQDTLGIFMAAAQWVAGKANNFIMQNYYDNLTGVNQRLIGLVELSKRGSHITPVPITVTSVLGNGQWDAATAINATQDVIKANTDYAVLGFIVRQIAGTSPSAVSIRGSDTGNLRLACPSSVKNPMFSSRYFVELTRAYFAHNPQYNPNDYGFIPVINGSNKGGTFVEICANDTGGIVYQITLVLQELIGQGA